jgi:hypothetical protein
LGVTQKTAWFMLHRVRKAVAAAESGWIVDHALIDDDASYIVCAIGQRDDKSTYLYKTQTCLGWQFKQRLAGCYAAIPMPQWKGLPDVRKQEA